MTNCGQSVSQEAHDGFRAADTFAGVGESVTGNASGNQSCIGSGSVSLTGSIGANDCRHGVTDEIRNKLQQTAPRPPKTDPESVLRFPKVEGSDDCKSDCTFNPINSQKTSSKSNSSNNSSKSYRENSANLPPTAKHIASSTALSKASSTALSQYISSGTKSGITVKPQTLEIDFVVGSPYCGEKVRLRMNRLLTELILI